MDTKTADGVLETIKTALAEFDVDPARVTPEASFESLELDSLDLVELSIKIEDAYDISIEEDDLSGVATVGDAVTMVSAKIGS